MQGFWSYDCYSKINWISFYNRIPTLINIFWGFSTLSILPIKPNRCLWFVTKWSNTVEHIKTILNTQIQLSNTTIICNFKECDSIRYPKVYLESILQNLITNSIKYRSKDRDLIIEMTSKKLDDGILFICKDNGMGIDLKKFGDKIFGMNKTFHLNLDSRGMGLFITRNQIESLGGSISVESEPEKGAEFSIVFG